MGRGKGSREEGGGSKTGRGKRRAERTASPTVPRSHFRVPRLLFSSPCAASRRSPKIGVKFSVMAKHETATLAGGCFWCLEAAFQDLKGVEKVQSGYAGGRVANPSYEDVCTGTTGHAEVVQITFDPTVVSFNDLLHVFFTIHDPTTLNRQGEDVGP